ncbi:helix-turn-helix domain-containing protein [Rhizobium sp. P32RR-XVIII]|uniref:helix-turn-helix domain-containing protein n=1 Tax=Rhizobium sp. P32RR-XVIII TaxID=2726738 RepID=UPI001456C94F|nr:helix-turn-helix domain-containing protein [Rhizobium sp. P32RR-XVIII]NLS03593.1 helix-turn-helix domain-containing protein [Rhizobium sp. P32RR-XVIII]
MNVVARVQTYTCPCCGGFIGEAAPIQAVIDSEKSWVSKAILEALSKPVGKRMRRDALIEAIYQLDDEPDGAANSFRVTLSHLRRRVQQYGWLIQTEGSKGSVQGLGAVYRLIPVEAGQ